MPIGGTSNFNIKIDIDGRKARQETDKTTAALTEMAAAADKTDVAVKKMSRDTSKSAKALSAMRKNTAALTKNTVALTKAQNSTTKAVNNTTKAYTRNSKAAKKSSRETGELSKNQNQLAQSFGVSAKNAGLLNGIIGAGVFAGAILATAQLSHNLVTLADEFVGLSARIKIANGDNGDFDETFTRLFDTAQRTGTALTTTTTLFQRIALSKDPLKATTDEMHRFVLAAQQLGTISGSGPQELNAALIQLSQGLSGEVFRAQELNSILEQTPAIASAIAKGLGVSRGEMRKLVLEGTILSTDVFDAILSQTEDINRQFKTITQRLGQFFNRLSNEVLLFAGRLDEAVGFTDAIKTGITATAEAFSEMTASIPKDLDFGNLKGLASVLLTITEVALATVIAFKALAIAQGLFSASMVVLTGAINGTLPLMLAFEASILSLSVTANIATLSLGTILGAIALVAGAGAAGFAIGTTLREEFLEARLFGLAFVEAMLVGVEHIKQVFANVSAAIRAVWSQAMSFLREELADVLREIGGALQKLPDRFGGVFGKEVLLAADSLELASKSTFNLREALKENEAQFDKNTAAIHTTISEMVDFELTTKKVVKAVKELNEAKDKASGFDAKARAAAKLLEKAEEKRLKRDQKIVDNLRRKVEVLRLNIRSDKEAAVLSRLSAQGVKLHADEVARLSEEYDKLTANQAAVEAFQNMWNNAFDSIGDSFSDLLQGNISSFDDFTDSILGSFKKMIADMIAQAAKAEILNFAGIGTGTGGFGSLAAGAASFFGGTIQPGHAGTAIAGPASPSVFSGATAAGAAVGGAYVVAFAAVASTIINVLEGFEGSTRRVLDELSIGIRDGQISGSRTTTDVKDIGGFHSRSRTTTNIEEFEGDFLTNLQKTLVQTEQSVVDAFNRIGGEVTIAIFDGFESAFQTISIKSSGQSSGIQAAFKNIEQDLIKATIIELGLITEQQKELEAVYQELFDAAGITAEMFENDMAVLGAIIGSTGVGGVVVTDETFERLQATLSILADIDSNFRDLRHIVADQETFAENIIELSLGASTILDLYSKIDFSIPANIIAAGAGATELIKLADDLDSLEEGVTGVEALQGLIVEFFGAFASSAEQFNFLQTSLSESFKQDFKDVGRSQLPDTRAELLEFSRSLDLTTEAGRKAQLSLIQQTETYNIYFDALEAREGALKDIITSVDEGLAKLTLTNFEFQMRALRIEVEETIQAADDLGASEGELAKIRLLGFGQTIKLIADQKKAQDDFLSDLSDDLNSLTSSGVKGELKSIQDALEDTIAKGKDLDLSQTQLIDATTAAQIRYTGALKDFHNAQDDFFINLQGQIANTDASRFVKSLNGIKRAFDKNVKAAEELELGTEGYTASLGLATKQIENLISDLGTSITNLVAKLSIESPIRAAIIAEQELFDAQEERYQSSIDSEKQLADFIESLQIQSGIGTPQEQLEVTRAAFEKALTDQDVSGATSLASTLLTQFKEVNASAGFAEVFKDVNTSLESLRKVIGDTPQADSSKLDALLAVEGAPERQTVATELLAAMKEYGSAKDVSLDAVADRFGVDLDILNVDIENGLGNLLNGVGVLDVNTVNAINGVLSGVDGLDANTKAGLLDVLTNASTNSVNEISAVDEVLGGIISTVDENVLEAVEQTLTPLDSIDDAIGSLASKEDSKGFFDLVSGLWQEIGFDQAARDNLRDIAMIDYYRDSLTLLTQIFTAISGQASQVNIVSVAGTTLLDLAALDLITSINGFATGSPNIQGDQLAQIHDGEIIIDAASSEILRTAGINISAQQGGNDAMTAAVVEELKQLRQEVQELRLTNAAIGEATVNAQDGTTLAVADGLENVATNTRIPNLSRAA